MAFLKTGQTMHQEPKSWDKNGEGNCLGDITFVIEKITIDPKFDKYDGLWNNADLMVNCEVNGKTDLVGKHVEVTADDNGVSIMDQKFNGKNVDNEVEYKCWIIDSNMNFGEKTTKKIMNIVNTETTDGT